MEKGMNGHLQLPVTGMFVSRLGTQYTIKYNLLRSLYTFSVFLEYEK